MNIFFFQQKKNTSFPLTPIPYPLHPDKGFTLIEILVVVSIMGIILGGSIAGYTRFNERQIVIGAGKEFLTNMRQAQVKATSGVKTNSGCQSLLGYRIIAAASGSSYTVFSLCSNATYSEDTYSLPVGVTFQSAVNITFMGQLGGVQGVAAAGTDINLRTSTLTYTINVNQAGGILDSGLQ